MWKSATPQLPVRDVRATQEYYRDVLGFEIAWLWQDSYGAVYNDAVQIYFTKMDDALESVCCCIDVEDADAVYAKYKASGAKVVSEIETKPWGMREFTIEDPNGHLFRVGQGVKPVSEIADFTTGS